MRGRPEQAKRAGRRDWSLARGRRVSSRSSFFVPPSSFIPHPSSIARVRKSASHRNPYLGRAGRASRMSSELRVTGCQLRGGSDFRLRIAEVKVPRGGIGHERNSPWRWAGRVSCCVTVSLRQPQSRLRTEPWRRWSEGSRYACSRM